VIREFWAVRRPTTSPKNQVGSLVHEKNCGKSVQTASDPEIDRPDADASTDAVTSSATGCVATTNSADNAPAGTATVGGTITAAWALDSATCKPPAGAGADKVTFPTVPAPPNNARGAKSTAKGRVARPGAVGPLAKSVGGLSHAAITNERQKTTDAAPLKWRL